MPDFIVATPQGRFKVTGVPDETAAYAAVVGQTPTPTPAKPPDTLSDVGQSIGSGLATGGMTAAGLPGDMASGVGQGLGWLSGFVGANPEQRKSVADWSRRLIPLAGQMPTSGEIQSGINKATGYVPYVPQTEIGRFANKAASFVPAAAAVGATGGLSAIPGAIAAGIGSGLAAQGVGDVAATVGGEKLRPYGEAVGGVLGGFGPAAARRALTPFPVPANPTRAAAVTALQNEGVNDLTAGQRSGSIPLRYAESEVGGSHVAQTTQNQGEQYTAAVLNRSGINANRATADVVDNGFTRVGNDFNQLATRNTLVPDPQLQTDATGAVTGYFRNVSEPNRAPIVVGYLTEIGNAIGANGGRIPGDVYQSLRSRIAADARGASDQYVQRALNDLREALDTSMERSIAVTNPGDLGAWRQARDQYRALLVIEKAATGAGQTAGEGIISPAKLREATISVYGRRAYARGGTPFDELARAGSVVMTPLPQSGTAPRLAARAALGAPAIAGAIIGGKAGAGDVTSTLAGLVAGGMTAAAARAFLNSAWGRAYLANQAFRGNPSAWQNQAIAPAINTTQQYRLPSPPVPMLPRP